MDDNKKPKKEETPDEIRKKAGRYAAYVYIALAICIVVVMSISIYSMTSNLYQDPEISIPTPSQGTTSNNGEKSVPPVVSKEPDASQVGNDASGIEAEESEEPKKAVFVHPVDGTIIKEFTVTSLVFSQTMKDYRTHNGVDIKADAGTGVLAYTDGKITKIENDPLMGTTIEITHEYALKSYYKSLDSLLPEGIAVGKEVKAGDLIGAVGETAIIEAADPAHLHFELTVNGDHIDPKKELELID